MQKIRFMGAAEIGKRLGVGRNRVYQITRDRDFPAPYQTLTMGSIWTVDDVEAWIREHRPGLAEEAEGE
ncbi:DNA-binding protein [Actinoplanes sp. NEAU-A12]|uniref:DNA-binding protein n=1 Tax=Actinoplanes sandaracinus TaxID=3045177 RepID=A0ABT6WJ38_9ACTN|nr:DNA-binding protein [Actinoplanes sandaracinus]MDI6099745.1 DNA-binding protein [Actinoplanes sandaracinus]